MSKLIQGLGQFFNYTLHSLDMSSGANDVVVIKHRDGSLHSSPFHVRFGKYKVLRPGEKVVYVEVNGKRSDAFMKMGNDGVAFWLDPTTDSAALPSHMLASPLGSPDGSPVVASAPHMPRDASGSDEDELMSPLPPSVEAANAVPIDAVVSRPPAGQVAAAAAVSVAVAAVDAAAAATEVAADVAGAAGAAATELLHPTPAAAHADPHAQPDAVAPGDPDEDVLLAAKNKELHALYKQLSFSTQRASAEAGELRLSTFASIDGLSELGEKAIQECESYAGDMEAAMEKMSQSQHGRHDEGTSQYSDETTESDEMLEELGVRASLFKKTLNPVSSDLHKLHLVDGLNTVTFTTKTTLRGMVTVECRVFLWDESDSVVVSDIDGTVTKSDVLGHILPRLGRDWTHPGICGLYTKIAKNGYHMMYLSARSVSQIEQTKAFLKSVRQEGMELPDGPVLVAPDKIFAALNQEVFAKKSHEFKIACLTGLKNAFPAHRNPLYAGFGNRIGDVVAYTAVGIPQHKIFVIDVNSVVHVCQITQTYKDLGHLVDATFPTARKQAECSSDYNSFNYWRVDPADLLPPTPQQKPQSHSSPALTPTQPQQLPSPSGSTTAMTPDPASHSSWLGRWRNKADSESRASMITPSSCELEPVPMPPNTRFVIRNCLDGRLLCIKSEDTKAPLELVPESAAQCNNTKKYIDGVLWVFEPVADATRSPALGTSTTPRPGVEPAVSAGEGSDTASHGHSATPRSATPQPTEFYNIRSVLSDKYANVKAGSTERGARIWQHKNPSSSHTQFRTVRFVAGAGSAASLPGGGGSATFGSVGNLDERLSGTSTPTQQALPPTAGGHDASPVVDSGLREWPSPTRDDYERPVEDLCRSTDLRQQPQDADGELFYSPVPGKACKCFLQNRNSALYVQTDHAHPDDIIQADDPCGNASALWEIVVVESDTDAAEAKKRDDPQSKGSYWWGGKRSRA